MWNHNKFVCVLGNETKALNWSKQKGLIPQGRWCIGATFKKHRKTAMKCEKNGKYERFRCPNCRRSESILRNTWFSQIHVTSISKIYRFITNYIPLVYITFLALCILLRNRIAIKNVKRKHLKMKTTQWWLKQP